MSILKIVGFACVGLILATFVALLAVQQEPVRTVANFETEILDRRYQGVSVVTGAPTEAEIRIATTDGRVIWLPALRYFLDDTLKTACIAQNEGRLTGLETYAPANPKACLLADQQKPLG